MGLGQKAIRRYAIFLVAWLPFFAIWVLFALLYSHYRLPAALASSMISMGSASLLGIAVWHVCQWWPWPLRPGVKFYLLQVIFATLYSVVWTISVDSLEWMRGAKLSLQDLWRSPVVGWQLLMGVWLYGLFAGVSYSVQTRNRLQEKEALAARAEALAAVARLDAIRARLNPHFLFNALHTLAALVKFRPTVAESAMERLGDMLRYTLKEDGRELVEFSEECDFTRQYIAFEQLRYEDRLIVDLQIDPGSSNFDIPPFAIQALAENAVRHVWKQISENRGKLYTQGLFRYSRHPNYLGDLLLFSGMCLIAGMWMTAIIPMMMLAGFVFVNNPVLDSHLHDKYGAAFDQYAVQTRKLIPFLY